MKLRITSLLASLLCFSFLPGAAFAVSTFVVSNPNDAGAGSLRQAILDANATSNSGGPDLISFAIPGDGPHTIFPVSALPAILDPVIIDGYTQGSSTATSSDNALPNTLAVGNNAVLKIALSGVGAPAGTNGLMIEAGNCTVRGLVIKGFTGIGDSNTISPTGGIAITIRSKGGNLIEGNFLGGTLVGQNLVDSNSHGVQIGDSNGNGATNNLLGGTAPAARNLISGNAYAGIGILSAASTGNQIQGNYIGTDRNGTTDNLNRFGVILSAPNNTIGGTADGAGNIISANLIDGIRINTGGNSNTIQGNYIGTDATGTIKTAELGNGFSGIMISNASNNIIGGTGAGTGNVISGNDLQEIQIVGSLNAPATGNKIEGNYIGTDKTGTIALASSPYGVAISEAANNFVGGTAPGAGNVISGHSLASVSLSGSSATGNLVQGNLIGTDVTGMTRLGGSANAGAVSIHYGRNNTIGGSAPGARNIISGNDGAGVYIESLDPTNTTSGNKIQGNYIGTDITGTHSLPNGFGGVVFYGGADNTIGGTGAGEGNLISGNIGDGIALHDADLADTRDNKVQGNLIGTDRTGAFDLGNTKAGVLIEGSYRNTIGGTNDDAGNVISGNDGPGIFITGATAQNNQVSQNLIGRNAANDGPLGNAGHGILLQSSGPNVIGGGFNPNNANTIAHNGGDGVAVVFGSGPCIKKGIISNSIFSNAGLGIDLGDDGVTRNDAGDGDTGANTLQNFPILTSATTSGGNTTINGSFNSTPNTSFHLEFFASAAADPTGYGEGQTFLGFKDVMTDGSGNVASFSAVLPVLPPAGQTIITATATDNAELANTSEFSNAVRITGTAGRLLNIATRLRVQTGENVLIGGFIITGTDAKKVMIRGIGPSLSQFFSGVLANPTLELYQGDALLQANDDWKLTQQGEIEATGIQPANDFESAIVRTLSPGGYTAIVRGAGGGTGIGLVEAYDLDQAANSELANIATRGFVDAGDDVMIGGLIAGGGGGGAVKVVVRAIGPSLANAGIGGALEDPSLELRDVNGALVAENNNWRQTQEPELQATGIPPNDDRESAILAILTAGNYTAIVRGEGNATGVGLVEVYNVQ